MKDPTFELLQKRYREIYALQPSDLHGRRLTNIYKLSTGSLKSFPFKVLVPIAFVCAVFCYALLGVLVTRLVSILQGGF